MPYYADTITYEGQQVQTSDSWSISGLKHVAPCECLAYKEWKKTHADKRLRPNYCDMPGAKFKAMIPTQSGSMIKNSRSSSPFDAALLVKQYCHDHNYPYL